MVIKGGPLYVEKVERQDGTGRREAELLLAYPVSMSISVPASVPSLPAQ